MIEAARSRAEQPIAYPGGAPLDHSPGISKRRAEKSRRQFALRPPRPAEVHLVFGNEVPTSCPERLGRCIWPPSFEGGQRAIPRLSNGTLAALDA